MNIREIPAPKCLFVFKKITPIVYSLILAKRNIEVSALIKSAKSIETGSVEIIEQGSCLFGFGAASAYQSVEFLAPGIIVIPFIQRFEMRNEAMFQLSIEVN